MNLKEDKLYVDCNNNSVKFRFLATDLSTQKTVVVYSNQGQSWVCSIEEFNRNMKEVENGNTL